jgi:hypothetical protein
MPVKECITKKKCGLEKEMLGNDVRAKGNGHSKKKTRERIGQAIPVFA